MPAFRQQKQQDARRDAELAVIGCLLNPVTRENVIRAIKETGLDVVMFSKTDIRQAYAQIRLDAKTEWGIMETSAEAIPAEDVSRATAYARLGSEREAVEKVLNAHRAQQLAKTITDVTDKIGNFGSTALALDELVKRLGEQKRDWSKARKIKRRTLADFSDPCPDELDDACLFQNRWLRRGNAAMIVATSGVGKSVITTQLAYNWAVGRECFGMRPVRKTVKDGRSLADGGMRIAIFQSEDDDYAVSKFRRGIRRGLAIDGWTAEEIALAESRVSVYGNEEIGNGNLFEFMAAAYDLEPFDLAIVNPVFGFFHGDINDNEEAGKWLRFGLDPLIKKPGKEFGCILVHHTPKPKADDLRDSGNIFSAYMGHGAGEFTNYIRSAIALVPWRSSARGSKPQRSIYRLVAAKNPDPLDWKTANGKRTDEKIICYAYRVGRFKQEHGLVYWAEPTAEEFAEIKADLKREKEEKEAEEATGTPEAAAPSGPIVRHWEQDARVIRIAEWIKQGDPKTTKDVRLKIRDEIGFSKVKDSSVKAHVGITRILESLNANLDTFGIRTFKGSGNSTMYTKGLPEVQPELEVQS